VGVDEALVLVEGLEAPLAAGAVGLWFGFLVFFGFGFGFLVFFWFSSFIVVVGFFVGVGSLGSVFPRRSRGTTNQPSTERTTEERQTNNEETNKTLSLFLSFFFVFLTETSFHHRSPASSRPVTFLTVQKSAASRTTQTTKLVTKEWRLTASQRT